MPDSFSSLLFTWNKKTCSFGFTCPLNWKTHCEDHSSLSSITAVHMNYFIYTYIISLLTGRYELNKLTSLPMCGFIAQLVEHRTGIAEVTGSNPVEALIFFRLLLSSCLNWKTHYEDHSSLSETISVHKICVNKDCCWESHGA